MAYSLMFQRFRFGPPSPSRTDAEEWALTGAMAMQIPSPGRASDHHFNKELPL